MRALKATIEGAVSAVPDVDAVVLDLESHLFQVEHGEGVIKAVSATSTLRRDTRPNLFPETGCFSGPGEERPAQYASEYR